MVVVTVLLGVFGFCLIPIIGVGYSFTSMNSFPISAAASCGIVHIANAAFSSLLTALVSIFIENHRWVSIGILLGSVILSIFFGIFITETINKS
jgi:hypothetical protein